MEENWKSVLERAKDRFPKNRIKKQRKIKEITEYTRISPNIMRKRKKKIIN